MLAEFHHPKLVAVYDDLNGYRACSQADFYPELATESRAQLVLDVGCGTGLLTQGMARYGRNVVGVDPSEAMIGVAKQRPNCPNTTWLVGEVRDVRPSDLSDRSVDFAFMGGHVAQFFLTDQGWAEALSVLRGLMCPGAILAFESRNPGHTGWGDPNETSVHCTPLGAVTTWTTDHRFDGEVLHYTHHFAFDDGEELEARSRLRFRSQQVLAQTLASAGFAVESVFGWWDRSPVMDTSAELIVVAQAV